MREEASYAGRLWGRGVEWDHVQALLAQDSQTPMGHDCALRLSPLPDPDCVRRALLETRQARQAFAVAGPPPWGVIPDLRASLEHAETPGSTLEGGELAAFVPFLQAATRLRAYGGRVESVASDLAHRYRHLPILPELSDLLSRSLTEDGALKDEASPALRRVRQAVRDLRREIVKRLETIVSSAEADTTLQDRYVTLRHGRYVLPVRAEARSRLRGIVHDRSQSGATLFVEPEAVVETNNDLIQKLREEEAEAARILRAITDEVRDQLSELQHLVQEVGALDLITARAHLAERMEATEPELAEDNAVELREARHPLLLAQSWKEPTRPVVPVDLCLSRDRPLLMVTGPNAGGKTIALKCLGLLALMAQAGLHLPVKHRSRLPVFSRVFAVVGDEQSVAENLSTFSAFVEQVKVILDEVDQHSLVLLDELGAGTDPEEGAALAQAILEQLERRGALVMATTHLEPLKAFATVHPGARNASVEFDGARLAPTFRLVYDRPGRSYALAIGAGLGLPAPVIERAEATRSVQSQALDELLSRLGSQARDSADRAAALEREQTQLAALMAKARQELQQAQTAARETVAKARAEATALLTEIRRAVAHEWERLKRDERSKKALEGSRKRLAALVAKLPQVEPIGDSAAPRVGDTVEVAHLGLKGALVAQEGNTASIQAGTLSLRVPIGAVRVLSGTQAGAGTGAGREARRSRTIAVPEKLAAPRELHLLGKTTDEAQALVEKYLDTAFLAGLHSVRLVHGKGTGALRKAVHELLAVHPLVESFRPGEPHEGGGGATVVELRAD
ncbi:MAG: endonuclease MutS2 [Candidatus Methylomirabilia bacterium]